jgi:DNA-binding transcriptional regulator LsrR (DeoR family)/transcriptional regulator with XRE-family HTH domain
MDAGLSIAQRIKELRILNGLSQAATAEALSMPLRTYQTWEKDFTSSAQNLINICNYFGVSAGIILKSIQESSNDPVHDLSNQFINLKEYKIKFFDMALEGLDENEIFSWYETEYPDQAALVDDRSKFITNCFLDIYHFRHKALTNLNFGRDKTKEQRIGKKFNIPADHIVVTKSGHIKHEILREMLIARYGAEWIIDWSIKKPGFRIGLSNGFTIARILDFIPRGSVENLNLFPLNFTNSPVDFPISATALISSFMYKGTGYGIVTDTMNEEQVFSSMLLADAAFLGIGTFSNEGLYEKMIRSVRGQGVVENIREKGVIGDLNYHLLDRSGKEIHFPEIVSNIGEHQPDSLIKSIGLKNLKDKADKGGRIVIAGSGEYKADTVRVALENRFANYLITDETIADTLLD